MAKVLVSLEDALLRRIDRVARAQRMSRSAYLAQLARRDLARASGPGNSPAARRALARLDSLVASTPTGDSTAAIRAERDAR
jgi:metal-responsive CopG/Arc/MetJ family transcriptional regulator